jgi:hypothetical protein
LEATEIRGRADAGRDGRAPWALGETSHRSATAGDDTNHGGLVGKHVPSAEVGRRCLSVLRKASNLARAGDQPLMVMVGKITEVRDDARV